MWEWRRIYEEISFEILALRLEPGEG